MRRVGVGMISFDHIHAGSYAESFNRIRGCRLLGIADEKEDQGRKAAERHGVPFMLVEELLGMDDVEAVCICSANARHREYVEMAAEAGKNIMVEKPIATTAEDARAMIDKCRQEDVFLQVAFVMRYNPIAIEAKGAIDSGQVGDIIAMSGTNHGTMPGGWFTEKELSGGGAIIDHTVHVADLMNWFLGERAKRVFAVGGNRLYEGLGIDDSGFVLVKYDQAIGSIDPSWSRPPGYPIWGDVRMRIFGSKATLELDGFSQNMALTKGGDRLRLLGFGSNADLHTCLDLVNSTRQENEPRSKGEDGLAALEIALAAYESMGSARPVSLR